MLPYDLSGSRSKNRFRNEMMWGLEKIYEIYRTGKDFCIVFDYVCDIEIHMDSVLEFYQVKTNNASAPYTINKITKCGKDGHSILGKIYILKHIANENDKNVKIKIAIVSNTPIKGEDKKIYASDSELELIVLDDKSKKTIKDNIQKELSIDTEIELEDNFYIYTSMDLFNPQDSLLGKTINFFIELTGKEPKQVTALYRLLTDTINIKANYEYKCTSYNEVMTKKGIQKGEFEQLIKKHIDVANESVAEAKNIIDQNYPSFSDRLQLKTSLSQVVQELTFNKSLINLENTIANYILTHLDEFNENIAQTISELYKLFSGNFNIEYNSYDKQAFIIFILAKMQEGLYE